MTVARIRAIKVRQPIGDFFVGAISFEDLIGISSADMRVLESDLDRYVGIQRRLSAVRVKEIAAFVNTVDATFPTSVVLAVRGTCARFDEAAGMLELFEGVDEETGDIIPRDKIASILDGQHRIEGLGQFKDKSFDVPVSIFIDADVADQAYIFATVNLAQTKVNKSLVYDLLDYARARSPQKSCHDIAVALDRFEGSPFFKRIKRLGTATEGRSGETLAQATVVGALIPMVSINPLDDRDQLARGRRVHFSAMDYQKTPLRGFWVDERDSDIARMLISYFNAVQKRWPNDWRSLERGNMLPRTNGFRALIRFFKNCLLSLRPRWDPGIPIPQVHEFTRIFDRSDLEEGSFSIEKYSPGTSGEKGLYEDLRRTCGL